ncbi:GNAT family N-acetyltransferase [Microbacterium sulfonylureivorans]|uniref:GNAT family N-acetyltransferase n=1 Tax=Microbacterium sulfonylureivorans TaxID=2486854 RepID=UPI000FDCBE94|nr:GNAT family N-acetyltransferase [Microbacterium sulfonylureivorans]
MQHRVAVRRAVPSDLDSIAALKEEWAALPARASAEERDEFARALGEWWEERSGSVICFVAEVDTTLIGMAWLVIFERVPDIRNHRRRTGDIQSVYVRPGYRGAGIGSQLLAGLVAVADELQIPRVTVSANSKAAALYEAQGFAAASTLLERRFR